MPDREKVLKGLACVAQKEAPTANPCAGCGYADRANFAFCVRDIAADALSLLKEHEAVKPIAKEDDMYECICGAVVGWDELDASGIVQTRLNYCPFCGRAVNWE